MEKDMRTQAISNLIKKQEKSKLQPNKPGVARFGYSVPDEKNRVGRGGHKDVSSIRGCIKKDDTMLNKK